MLVYLRVGIIYTNKYTNILYGSLYTEVFLNLEKPHKKRLAASLRTSLIQYMVGPVGLEPTTKGL